MSRTPSAVQTPIRYIHISEVPKIYKKLFGELQQMPEEEFVNSLSTKLSKKEKYDKDKVFLMKLLNMVEKIETFDFETESHRQARR